MKRAQQPRGLRPHQLAALLGKQPPAPLYVCLGEESYVAEQALRLLQQSVVGTELREFNDSRFTAGEAPAAEIVNAALTLPAFADRRLVVVTQAEALTSDDQDTLLSYLEQPASTTTLVFVSAKVDQRRRFFSRLLERATIVNCQPFFERELPGWVQEQAAALGLRLSPDALQLLIERNGAALHLLSNELEKLRVYASAGGGAGAPATGAINVTVGDVQAVSSGGRGHSIFELTDAVGSRQLQQALTVARNLLEEGEYPPALVTTLTRHLRRLWIAKSVLEAGGSTSSLASRLGVAPRYVETLKRQSDRHTRRGLEAALARCLTAEAQLKGGRLPKSLAVELLIVELCSNTLGKLAATPR